LRKESLKSLSFDITFNTGYWGTMWLGC